MRILLIGSGGREHALAWRLAQSPQAVEIFAASGGVGACEPKLRTSDLMLGDAAMGNPGIAQLATILPLNDTDDKAIVQACQDYAISLVVIGPEAPLVRGLADSLRAQDIAVFGPSAAAAQLEGSKAFTKALCARANIPTAAYVFCTQEATALAALDDFALPVVIKADGLAAGKGVVIAETQAQAQAAVRAMFAGDFGAAGMTVVIEEFMTGAEVSVFALSDGVRLVPFGHARDHKRVGEGDRGPNSGGMGAYSPSRLMTPALEAEIYTRILHPTIAALAIEGTPYVGVLYAGLMITLEGPKLVEYNCRFGDPECQVLMMSLQSDLVQLLDATARGKLADCPPPTFDSRTALTIVLAARGYPSTPQKGGEIRYDENALVVQAAAGADDGVAGRSGESIASMGTTQSPLAIFHAGTIHRAGRLCANGGRVLNVTALGDDIGAARARAYVALEGIDFADGFYRRDIGLREMISPQEDK